MANYPTREWVNVPPGTQPPAGAPAANAAFFEELETWGAEVDGERVGIIHFCTSATRPTGVPTNYTIGETDTGLLYRNAGDATTVDWQPLSGEPDLTGYAQILGDPADGQYFAWSEADGSLVPVDAPSGGGGAFEAWQSLATTNGWVASVSDFGASPLSFTKDSQGLVLLRGYVSGGQSATSDDFAVLPAGYRPQFNETFEVLHFNDSSGTYSTRRLNILSGGTCQLPGRIAGFYFLSGKTFKAA